MSHRRLGSAPAIRSSARCHCGSSGAAAPQPPRAARLGGLRPGAVLQRASKRPHGTGARSHSTATQGGYGGSKKEIARAAERERLKQVLDTELDALQARLRVEGNKFTRWRQRNTAVLLTVGAVAGGLTLAIGCSLYVRNHPQIIDYVVAWLAKVEFDNTKGYEGRKQLYMKLPEPQISVSSLEAQILAALAEEASKADGSTATDGAASAGADAASNRAVALGWANMATMAFAAVDGSHLLRTKGLMRRALIDEICSRDLSGTSAEDPSAAIVQNLAELRDILPQSVERNIYVAEQLTKYIEASDEGWVPAEVLEANRPQHPAMPADASISLLRSCISFFPGPINKLILFLDGQLKAEDVARALLRPMVTSGEEAAVTLAVSSGSSSSKREMSTQTAVAASALEATVDDLQVAATVAALETVAQHYRALHPNIKQYVLHQSLTGTIAMLTSPTFLKGAAGPRPYQLYQRAIDTDLLGPLRRDAQISEDVLTQVKGIYLALPAPIQARILLTAVQHPAARTSWAEDSAADVTYGDDKMATAIVVRDLLSAGGVVAVKLAQVIAEDPRVPEPYSSLLGELREDNTPMSLATFYHNLPTAIRARLSHLGRCLGTGSVKQVHAARFRNDGLSSLLGKSSQGGASDKEVAVAVLRRNVEDEALASLSALEASVDLAPVAPRLGQLVYGEFNLFAEGEALKEFAVTAIGMHDLFHVVKVVHNSPRCLIEEIAAGPTLAKLLSPDGPKDPRYDAALLTLASFHRTVLRAFVEDGLIHSDIHLGNMALQYKTVEQQGDEKLRFVLFDVGQFAKCGPADTKALLWAVGWISTPHRRVTLGTVAVRHLVATSSLSSDAAAEVMASVQGKLALSAATTANTAKPLLDEAMTAGALAARIQAAFDIAVLPNDDGSVRQQKPAWLRFLRECEVRGVLLPPGAFAVSKMMDSILSQQETFGLPSALGKTPTARQITQRRLCTDSVLRWFACVCLRGMIR